MGYIDNNLMNNEKLLYRAKLHWIIFWEPLFFFVLAIGLYVYFGEGVKTVSLILLVLGVISAILPIINYTTSEFGVTNRRVIVKVGFIRRKSLEVMLNKVEGIHVDQSILGRILGYGSIVVSGTGGTKDPFKNISNPLTFRRSVQEQIVN